jgi:galactitol PTS system EIIB component
MVKKVLVASGTSLNKMKFAANTIKDLCSKKGITVEVKTVNIYDIKIENENADVIVVIGPNKFSTSIPIVSGMAFITKMGMEKTVDEIIEKLK